MLEHAHAAKPAIQRADTLQGPGACTLLHHTPIVTCLHKHAFLAAQGRVIARGVALLQPAPPAHPFARSATACCRLIVPAAAVEALRLRVGAGRAVGRAAYARYEMHEQSIAIARCSARHTYLWVL